jgi:hypothetical protein
MHNLSDGDIEADDWGYEVTVVYGVSLFLNALHIGVHSSGG